ncbi:hypothetical protein KEM56_003542 [Ascosphaera pollenicola]|nr:hypothetical protein KEM56_003542 [Ascosphaera pollenicola]
MHTESKPPSYRKAGSFLTRILHRKKDSSSRTDAISDDEGPDSGRLGSSHGQSNDARATGTDAEIFAQPKNGYAYVPQYPPPPKYIKVRSYSRKQMEFGRVFVAQELSDVHSKNALYGIGVGEDDANSGSPTVASSSNTQLPLQWQRTQQQQHTTSHAKAIWAIEFSQNREAHEIEEDARDDQSPIKLTAPVFKAQPVQMYEGHTGSVVDLSWSKNDFLLSTNMDKTVRLWHVTRSECLCVFKHHDFVTSIKFHPKDDRFFLAGSLDSKLRLWSIPDKSVAFEAAAPDMITAVAFTPDGKHAIAGLLNGMCIIYDTDGLKVLSQIHVGGDHRPSLHPPLGPHRRRWQSTRASKITGIDSIFLPPENPCAVTGQLKLLITSNDSRIRLYNFKDRALEVKLRGNENSASQIRASFSSDGRYIVCGSESRKAYIWPTEAMGALYDQRLAQGYNGGGYNAPHKEKDLEFRSFEVFEAQSAPVTNAVMAPVRTKQILGASSDLLYDLCNPPPVTLGGNDVAGDRKSSPTSETLLRTRKPYDNKGLAPQPGPTSPTSPTLGEFPGRPNHGDDDIPGYMAPASHPDGNILVTADTNGSIKVFRQDCGYWKRPTFHAAAAAFVGAATPTTGQTVSGVSGPVNMSRAVQNPSHNSHIRRLSILRHNSVSTKKSAGSATNVSALLGSKPPILIQKPESISEPQSAIPLDEPSTLTVPLRGPIDKLKEGEVPGRSNTVNSATPSERILHWRDNIAAQHSNTSAESLADNGEELRATLSASGWTARERTPSPSLVSSNRSRLSITNLTSLWGKHRSSHRSSSGGRFALRDRSKKVYSHHPYYNSREASTSQIDAGESRTGSRAPTTANSESVIVGDSRAASVASKRQHERSEHAGDGSVSDCSSMRLGKEEFLSLPGSPMQSTLKPDMNLRPGFVTSAGVAPLSPPSTTGDRDTVRDSTSVNRETWHAENEIEAAEDKTIEEQKRPEQQTQGSGRLGSGLAAGALYLTKLAAAALTSRRSSKTNFSLPKLVISGTNGTNTPISSVEHNVASSPDRAKESLAQLQGSQSRSSDDRTDTNTATSSRVTMDLSSPVSPAPLKKQRPEAEFAAEQEGQGRGRSGKPDQRFSFSWSGSDRLDVYDESEDDEQELRCPKCGHNDFRALKNRRLICTKCGTAMEE